MNNILKDKIMMSRNNSKKIFTDMIMRIGRKLFSRYYTKYRFLRSLGSYELSLLWSDFFEADEDHIKKTFDINKKWLSSGPHKIESLMFFVNPFGREPSAGPRNILGLAKYFSNKEIQIYFAVVSQKISDLKMIEDALKYHGIDAKTFLISKLEDVDSLTHSTVSIATYWPTAYPVLRYHNTEAKFYLIQDEETLFYPAGVLQYYAEYTYNFGFIGITNAEEIKKWYESRSHFPCIYFPPFIIRAEKRKDPNNTSIHKVFTYFRIDAPRNGPELLYIVLKEILRRYDLEVIIVGDKIWDKEFITLGWVGSYELQKIYQDVDVCLYLMFSRHPGVIPLECMDAGAIVLTNKKHISHSYLIPEYNALIVKPSPSAILSAFEKLVKDSELRKRLIINGYNTVDNILRDHDKKLEKMYKEMTRA
jgi:hypothetical protein